MPPDVSQCEHSAALQAITSFLAISITLTRISFKGSEVPQVSDYCKNKKLLAASINIAISLVLLYSQRSIRFHGPDTAVLAMLCQNSGNTNRKDCCPVFSSGQFPIRVQAHGLPQPRPSCLSATPLQQEAGGHAGAVATN